MRRSIVGVTVLAAALTGCTGADSELASAPDAGLGSGSVSLSAVAAPAVVSGAGHIEAGDGLRNFTFHAIRLPDGSVEGSYQILRTDLGSVFSVDVTCLAVVGNQAWIGGRIASTNDPTVRVGSISYFYAIDNGEGSGASPDVVSLARINDAEGRDIEFCTTRPTLLPPRLVQMGDVQIR
jgi:hypothetical protein